MVSDRYMNKLLILLCCLCFSSSIAINAPRSKPSDRIQADELETNEATEFLENFRSLRFASDFIWVAELEYMPKRGKTKRFDCLYYGTWHNNAHKVRLIFLPNEENPVRVEYLLISGKEPQAWKLIEGEVSKLSKEEWFIPFTQNSIYRPFDILMPFLHWEDANYVGPDKEKSRPVQVFDISPPSEQIVKNMPESVKISIDDDYNAMVACRYFINGEIEKEFKIISYKKVQDQWIIKSTDLRDNTTKDKTRLRIFEAAMNLKLDSLLFHPDYLKQPIPILESSLFEKL